MAEAVLFNIAKSLLQVLSSPLKDEFLLLWTSKSDLDRLQTTITAIKAVLLDAETKHATNDAVRDWLAKLRDEMYKADDLFDEISTRALQQKAMSGNKISKEVRLFFSKSKQLALLFSTAHRVKEIRGNLDNIFNTMNTFNFVTVQTEPTRPTLSRQEEHSHVNKDDIIGRDKDKESIVNILKADVGDGAHVSVIAIVGFGGSGKTALAQLVYNELKQVEGHFELCLWACANYFSELNVILEKLIACGTKDKCNGFQLEQLQEQLREKIRGKRYLLVLDDVWETDLGNWLSLKRLLDVGNIGSKVLVTTRSGAVAETLSAVKPYHHLGGLSDEDAWSLFKRFAFYNNESEKIQRMKETGKDIVKRCGNIPLAIRSIGSYLRDKDESIWLNVLDDKEISEANTDVMKVLKVSYADLSSSLKHCFAYCSLFPKDYVFNKDELIHLWMAQGFLETSDKEKSLERVGEENFYALLQRCFFQDVKKNEDDTIDCKMHDLLHDLAIKVAGRDCRMVENSTDSFKETHLHVSYSRETEFSEGIPPSSLKMKGLKTLLFHDLCSVERSHFIHRLCDFTSLRVLGLRYSRMEELPSSIGNLVHLRYLELKWNVALKKLPSSICKLQNLQTLKLDLCESLKKLPVDLKLLRLRHLEIRGCRNLTSMPSGLKQMTSLVSLDTLVVNNRSGGLSYLRDLNNLGGQLRIILPVIGWKNSVADAKESMLTSKRELKILRIDWDRADVAENMSNSDEVLDHLQTSHNLRELWLLYFPGTRISRWISLLENLTYLDIRVCNRCLHLPPFSQLHRLQKLHLSAMPLVEYMEDDICSDIESFFPSLVELRICNMRRLKGWWRQTTHGAITVEHSQPYASLPWFARLSSLNVSDCPELTDLPLFPYVKRLSLEDVNEKLVRQSVLRAPDCITSLSCGRQTWCRLEDLTILSVKDLVNLPHEWAQHSSALRKLIIADCPKLKSVGCHMLQCLTSLEELDILQRREMTLMTDDESEEENELILKRIKRMNVTSNIKGLHHLTGLEELTVEASEEPMTTPWIPPPNLKHLTIGGTSSILTTIPLEMHHFIEAFKQLSKLVSLTLLDNIDLSGIPWEALVSLRTLKLEYMFEMEHIPERCQYLSSLQELKIEGCIGLKCLPDWTTRLQELQVSRCVGIRRMSYIHSRRSMELRPMESPLYN